MTNLRPLLTPSDICCLAHHEDTPADHISEDDADVLTCLLNSTAFIRGGTHVIGDVATPSSSRAVVIHDFEVMVFPVTNLLFYRITQSCPSFHKGSTRPVENLNWLDCVIFANMYAQYLGMSPAYVYHPDARMHLGEDESAKIFAESVRLIAKGSWRLLTEAEWEYAACCSRGRDELQCDTGWNSTNSDWRTHAVGQKPPNGCGLHDMHGNTWDWTWNWFSPYERIGDDGFGPLSGVKKTGRGGCWYHTPAECHPKVRRTGLPNSFCNSHGTRLARTLR